MPESLVVFAVVFSVLVGIPQAAAERDEPAGPPVFFNHAYLVVDEKTFQEIAASEFLRNEFAGFALRTTKTGEGRTWSGAYLYGERTYLEFFPPGALDTPETCGVGFGVEKRDAIQVVRDRFSRLSGKPVALTLQTRVRDQRKIPWFYNTALPSVRGSMMETWVMEYHPEYLPTWFPSFPKEADPLSRRAYLADRYKADRRLGDIIGLTIALEAQDRTRMRDQLVALGYEVRSDEKRLVARGPDFEIAIVPATTKARGITEVRMTVRGAKQAEAAHRFGPRSVLHIGDNRATWTFRAEPENRENNP